MLKEGPPQNKSSRMDWFIWWRIDAGELHDQAVEYDTLGWFRAARKISVLCLGFSAAVTLAVVLSGFADIEAYVDVVLMAGLAVFIYFGHRWAMIAAMVIWTMEKVVGFIDTPRGFVFGIIWWCVYMHAFYLSFRVEQERKILGERTDISVF